MKHVFWCAILMNAGCVLLCAAQPMETTESIDIADSPGLEGELSVGVGWLSTEMGFENGFDDVLISRLEWPVDGLYSVLHGQLQMAVSDTGPTHWGVGVRGRYLSASGAEGTQTDEDFDDAGVLWLYSESDTDANISFFDGDVYLFARPVGRAGPAWLRRSELTAGLGWGEQRIETKDKNIRYTYDYGRVQGSSDGPMATYDISISGPRLSAGIATDVTPSLCLSGAAVWMPWIEAEADGHWLRRDYRFTQRAEGQGILLRAQAACQLTSSLAFYTAVEYSSLIADQRGEEDGSRPGVSYSGEPIVREITASSVGVELGLQARF